MRVIDAAIALYTLPRAWQEKSTGRWVSPARRGPSGGPGGRTPTRAGRANRADQTRMPEAGSAALCAHAGLPVPAAPASCGPTRAGRPDGGAQHRAGRTRARRGPHAVDSRGPRGHPTPSTGWGPAGHRAGSARTSEARTWWTQGRRSRASGRPAQPRDLARGPAGSTGARGGVHLVHAAAAAGLLERSTTWPCSSPSESTRPSGGGQDLAGPGAAAGHSGAQGRLGMATVAGFSP